MKDSIIHGESNVWSAAQRHRKIYGFDVHVGFEWNRRSVGYGNWCGHVLRKEDGHFLRWALDFEVESQRKNGRLKRAWKNEVEEESVKVNLRREDALCQSKWSVDIIQIAAGLMCIWPPSLARDTTRFYTLVCLFLLQLYLLSFDLVLNVVSGCGVHAFTPHFLTIVNWQRNNIKNTTNLI